MSDIKISEIIEAALNEKPATIKEKIDEILREKVTALVEAKREEIAAKVFDDEEESEDEDEEVTESADDKEDDDDDEDEDEKEDDDDEDEKKKKKKKVTKEDLSEGLKANGLYHHRKYGILKFLHKNKDGKHVFIKPPRRGGKQSWPQTISHDEVKKMKPFATESLDEGMRYYANRSHQHAIEYDKSDEAKKFASHFHAHHNEGDKGALSAYSKSKFGNHDYYQHKKTGQSFIVKSRSASHGSSKREHTIHYDGVNTPDHDV